MAEDLKNRTGSLEPKGVEAAARREPEAISFLREWLSDESGYDERVWPSVKQGLEENRLSDRSLFRG